MAKKDVKVAQAAVKAETKKGGKKVCMVMYMIDL